MKLQYFFKTLIILLLALCLLCPAFPALAYEAIDTDRKTALTVYFGKDEVHFSGAEFQLYRVADVSPSAQFTLTGDFAPLSRFIWKSWTAQAGAHWRRL